MPARKATRSAVGTRVLATAPGSAAICCAICASGSIASPSTAVTSADASACALVAKAALCDECALKVPRRRNIADGFSFDSLRESQHECMI